MLVPNTIGPLTPAVAFLEGLPAASKTEQVSTCNATQPQKKFVMEDWEEKPVFGRENNSNGTHFGRGRGISQFKPAHSAQNGRGGSNGFQPRNQRKTEDPDSEHCGDGEPEKKGPVTYIPPEPTDDESEMYSTGLNTGINFSKYDKIDVKITKQDGDEERMPPMSKTFENLGLNSFLLNKVKKCGYQQPTPVQKATIPLVMHGRDVMACAQTGSGKTASFILPIAHTLMKDENRSATRTCTPEALIVAPTRELAIQIWQETRKFILNSGLTSTICYGGAKVSSQLDKLTAEVNIVVATPGRLCGFLKMNRIDFSNIKFVVLDEADRMLDMGFKDSVVEIMSHPTMVPKTERQTLMYSATFPRAVQILAREFLRPNYLFAAIGKVGGACSDVKQHFIEITGFQAKKDKLIEIVSEKKGAKTIVFVETKRMADLLALFLCDRDVKSTSIHGDRDQQQREEALRDFRRGSADVLVATGVASRGLDIKNVDTVINFDMPKEVDEYVHRIGRTGRLGNCGVSITFYDSITNSALVPELLDIIKSTGQEIPDIFNGYSGMDCSAYDTFGAVDSRQNTVDVGPDDNEEW